MLYENKKTDAFTIPTVGIQIRQQSAKKMRKNALRVNRQEPSCTPNDPDKQKRIERASI